MCAVGKATGGQNDAMRGFMHSGTLWQQQLLLLLLLLTAPPQLLSPPTPRRVTPSVKESKSGKAECAPHSARRSM